MNQTHSVNSYTKNDYTMISLNIPNYLKTNFDNLIKFKRVSRTSMLVRLMETFLRYELKQMKNDNELNQLVTTLKNNNKTPSKVSKEPPMIPYSSDDEFMNDQFWKDRIG